MSERRGGRTVGTPNRRTRALQEEIERLGGDPLPVLAAILRGEEVAGQRPTVDHVLAAAKELRRLYWPAPVGRPVALPIPTDSGGDLRPAIKAALTAMSDGTLSPVEALAALQVVAAARAAHGSESSAADSLSLEDLLGGGTFR